jgi:hypothetical protein
MIINFQFWWKKLACSIVQSLSTASIQKAQNRPSTQHIKATSCIERSNTTIGAEEISIFLAIKHYQQTDLVKLSCN